MYKSIDNMLEIYRRGHRMRKGGIQIMSLKRRAQKKTPPIKIQITR